MLFPARRIAAEAHRRGIRILVDGAHAPAQLADLVGGLQSDWWVGIFISSRVRRVARHCW